MRDLTLALFALAIAACSVAQEPPAFGTTGVIEGFYGPPWSWEDRRAMIEFMGSVGLEAFVYAPKDDPYHRSRWREPYPAAQRAELERTIQTAANAGVVFHYAISPGGSMTYSDTNDYRALVSKIRAVRALGVRHIALFLDDVPPILTGVDRAAFTNLAEAHASLINRLHRDLIADSLALTVTPTTYTDAWGDPEYARRLGALTHPDVPFFWTGSDVVSPTITAGDGDRWQALLGRRVLIWDNYPVNDFARWRLFLGPVSGRAADLPGAIAGFFANPMNEAHASMIPLFTLAEYARDPAAYDPAGALHRAVRTLYGDFASSLLQPFLDAYGDYATDVNVFEPLFIPGRPIDVNAMRGRVTAMQTALGQLSSLEPSHPRLGPLVRDLRPFVEQTERRLNELAADSTYARRSDMLVYRNDLDRFRAAGGGVTVDGSLGEWTDARWIPLRRNGSVRSNAPTVAFRAGTDTLVIAVRVPGVPARPLSSPRTGEGDHLSIVLQHDMDSSRQGLTNEDLVILLPAPAGTGATRPEVLSFGFHGFMSKYLADNRNMQFTEFHVTTFGEAPAAAMADIAAGTRTGIRRNRDGWTAEIAIPLHQRPPRLHLSVTRVENGRGVTYSLSRLSYPANPATFATIIVNP